MKILVFSDQKKLEELFAPAVKSRSHTLEILPRQYCRNRLKQLEEPHLVYYDIHQMEEKAYWKELRFLLRQPRIRTAVLDSRGIMEDPAAFFHEGGADYLGKGIFKSGLNPRRLKLLQDFLGEVPAEPEAADAGNCEQIIPPALLIPDGDWKKVRQGQEYFFCFLYAELDLTSDWKKKSGMEHLKQVKETFHEYIRKTVEPLNGRIWMWNEFGGLVLFPYGEGPCSMVVAATRLMVNRTIASCEDFPFKTPISYRLGLHMGETVYRDRGKTGTIVSDTVNFVFHLGTKYAQPGNLYITRPVWERTHPGLKDLFLPEGEFEGREIFRMRRVL